MKKKLILFLILNLSFIIDSYAGSATWKAAPASDSWNVAANWTPETVPDDETDIATFDTSDLPSVSIERDNITVDSIVFNSSQFIINVRSPRFLFITGAGIINNSDAMQNFVLPDEAGVIRFLNSATAGSLTMFTLAGSQSGAGLGALVDFFDSSNASSGTFVNQPGQASGEYGGVTEFYDNSTAGNGTFINQGAATVGAVGGSCDFHDNATAENGMFIAEPATVAGADGGYVRFLSGTAANGTFVAHGSALPGAGPGLVILLLASASNGTFIADGGSNGSRGGTIFLADISSAGASRVQLYDRGTLDVSNSTVIIPPLTAGSLEGNGIVLLGANSLTVGMNNLDTTFAGTIEDGGSGGGVGGSLIKEGTGTLLLTRSSGYTGSTSVNDGTLLLKGRQTTGTGEVKVKSGTLAGTGTISGDVTIGTGRQSGAFLSPGLPADPVRNLTIRKSVTFQADSTLRWDLDSNTGAADQIIAADVIINGASFSATNLGTGSLSQGTVIRVIANKAGTPITGNFSNLPDGSTITIGSNTLQANYEGGDGNDLTLTVL